MCSGAEVLHRGRSQCAAPTVAKASTISSPMREHLTHGIGEAFMANHTRTERDLLGGCEVPAKAYYGVHTLRALENFAISGTPISIYPDLIIALACVKKAAA